MKLSLSVRIGEYSDRKDITAQTVQQAIEQIPGLPGLARHAS